MHPQDCPRFWEYEEHPRRPEVRGRALGVVKDLRKNILPTLKLSKDTRPVHRRLFVGMTPNDCEYFAGCYRGEAYKCLKHISVGIKGDDRVGYSPATVVDVMGQFAQEIGAGLDAIDAGHKLPHAQVPASEKLLYAVIFASKVFEFFLRIHPYVNGNGHAARFLVWAILGRYGYWPRRWTIDPKPADPPYTPLIREYRDGNKEPLETFFLNSIVGT